MLDVHPPHHPTHTWRDFFIHIATIVIGLLIAIGLEQSVELIHHHHQRELLDQDLQEESQTNIRLIDHDLQMASFEVWYDHAAVAVTRQRGAVRQLSLSPLPCIPGMPSDGSVRVQVPSEGAWITARENGITSLLPAKIARTYYRRSLLLGTVEHYRVQLFDNCAPLYAMEHRLAERSADGGSYTWRLSNEQSERFATLASEQSAILKGYCFRLRYMRSFEQDLLDGGRRINGALIGSETRDLMDPEDKPVAQHP